MTTQSFLVRIVNADGTHTDQLFTGITSEDAARGYFARLRESGNPKTYRRVYLYDQASQVPIDVYDPVSGNVDVAAAPVAEDFPMAVGDGVMPRYLGTPGAGDWNPPVNQPPVYPASNVPPQPTMPTAPVEPLPPYDTPLSPAVPTAPVGSAPTPPYVASAPPPAPVVVPAQTFPPADDIPPGMMTQDDMLAPSNPNAVSPAPSLDPPNGDNLP